MPSTSPHLVTQGILSLYHMLEGPSVDFWQEKKKKPTTLLLETEIKQPTIPVRGGTK